MDSSAIPSPLLAAVALALFLKLNRVHHAFFADSFSISLPFFESYDRFVIGERCRPLPSSS